MVVLMPRRNVNANAVTVSRDVLADQIAHLARELGTLLCAGCRANPPHHGDYCVLCAGHIIVDARRAVLARR
jgi:hypothetical protein